MRKPLAFVCHAYHRGGVTRWMVDAASNWAKRGFDSWFVVPRPRQPFVSGGGRPTLTQLVEELPADARPTLFAPLVGSDFEFGTAAYRARVYARAAHAALPPGTPVIVSDDASVWWAIELLRGRHPLIGVLHADDAPYYELASRFHTTAAAIVAVSQRVLSHVQAMIEGLETRAEVIPCGIVLPPPPVDYSEAAVTRLVWVGRISERQKRVSDLVRIALALEKAGHSFVLDVIGDGENAAELEIAVKEAGLAQRVAFHGWISSQQVFAILARSDIMLLPSNFEGMPVAAMESLACGCAVVGSDACGLQEYANRNAGREVLWIYPRGNISAAATAVAAAAAVAPRHRRAAARRFAAEEFAIDVCMDRYETLLGHMTPASVRPVGIASWHPADVVSRTIAFARRSRSALSRRVPSRLTSDVRPA